VYAPAPVSRNSLSTPSASRSRRPSTSSPMTGSHFDGGTATDVCGLVADVARVAVDGVPAPPSGALSSRSFEAVRLEARSQKCPAPPPHRSGSRRPRPWSPRSRWRRDLRPWPRSAARPPGQSRKHTSIPPSLRPLVGLRPIASRASNGTRRA
jgi:hypothetical protein